MIRFVFFIYFCFCFMWDVQNFLPRDFEMGVVVSFSFGFVWVKTWTLLQGHCFGFSCPPLPWLDVKHFNVWLDQHQYLGSCHRILIDPYMYHLIFLFNEDLNKNHFLTITFFWNSRHNALLLFLFFLRIFCKNKLY